MYGGKNNLNENEKKIAKYLTGVDLDSKTVEKIAEELFVSRATIYRVCKKMGFNSFTHFKFEYGKFKKNKKKMRGVDSLDIFEHVNDQHLEYIVENIVKAETVYIFATFASVIAAEFFERQLVNLGIKAFIIEDEFELKERSCFINKEDIIICLSNSGELTKTANKILENAISTVIGITKEYSTLERIAQISITFDFTSYQSGNTFDRENIFNIIVILQKILVNIREHENKEN